MAGNRFEVMFTAAGSPHQVAWRLAARYPRDDLITNLVLAEIDGQQLTNAEITAFFVLLAVAGNDTTPPNHDPRAAGAQRDSAQREWLLADFDNRIDSAVEELIRWASPVMTFRRTAVVHTELGGQRISTGNKVVIFYQSGNWDTEVFNDPGLLDLGRHPDPHLGSATAVRISAWSPWSPGRSCARSSANCCCGSPISRPASRICWRAASLTPCARCRAGSRLSYTKGATGRPRQARHRRVTDPRTTSIDEQASSRRAGPRT